MLLGIKLTDIDAWSFRIVPEFRVLVIVIEHIQPETIHPLIKPVTENIQHGRAHFGVAPV